MSVSATALSTCAKETGDISDTARTDRHAINLEILVKFFLFTEVVSCTNHSVLRASDRVTAAHAGRDGYGQNLLVEQRPQQTANPIRHKIDDAFAAR